MLLVSIVTCLFYVVHAFRAETVFLCVCAVPSAMGSWSSCVKLNEMVIKCETWLFRVCVLALAKHADVAQRRVIWYLTAQQGLSFLFPTKVIKQI